MFYAINNKSEYQIYKFNIKPRVTVTTVKNEIGNLSSNPRRAFLRFTSLGKSVNSFGLFLAMSK